jgi:predicted RNA binding protein YcfA (HicA-like mRNA interferase family)
MKIPRDLSGKDLIKLFKKYGYEVTRQKGSHIRLTKQGANEHHITVPDHSPVKIGTINKILSDVSSHLNIGKEELLKEL